jgi:hypothetical protein
MDKKLIADAEGLVWKEVEKGKQFIRAVGEWFGAAGSVEGINDAQLKALARRCGVQIKEEEEEMGMEHDRVEHVDKSGSIHSVQEVVFA